jgi:hypothetical protein
MMVDCLKFPSQIITRSTSSSVTSSARRSSCVSRHGFANMHALARREPRHAARRKPVEEFHGRARIGAARVRIPDLRGKKFKEAIGGALSGGDTSHGQITGYIVPPDEYEEFERFRAQRRPAWTRVTISLSSITHTSGMANIAPDSKRAARTAPASSSSA